MKIAVSLLLGFAWITTVQARLGETKSQLARRYGALVMSYHDGDQSILVFFHRGFKISASNALV